MGVVFRFKLPANFLQSVVDIPHVAQRQLRREMQTTVKPALQKFVDKTIAPYPPQRVPWGNGFGTAKSRRWYFANMVPKGSRGGRYQRTDKIKDSWVVLVDPRFGESIRITVRNLRPEAIYVYGPRQIPGHRKTGFGADFDAKFERFNDEADRLLSAAWLRSVQFAVKQTRAA